jgi:hypothetical protein
MSLQKVVCTDLNTRAVANAALDASGNWNCRVAGFAVNAGDAINVVLKGIRN